MFELCNGVDRSVHRARAELNMDAACVFDHTRLQKKQNTVKSLMGKLEVGLLLLRLES